MEAELEQLLEFRELGTWRLAISISALRPPGEAPTTRVRRRISRITRSSGLLARILSQCSRGK